MGRNAGASRYILARRSRPNLYKKIVKKLIITTAEKEKEIKNK